MKIVRDIIPREWAGTAFPVLCAVAGICWAGLLVVVGALTGLLPRDWVRTGVSTEVAAAVTVLILVAAVWSTAVVVALWQQIGAGDQQDGDER